MKTLSFLPLPMSGESPTSLIKRMARRNGYSNCEKFSTFHLRPDSRKSSPLMQGSRFENLINSQVGCSIQQLVSKGFYRLVDMTAPSGAFFIGSIRLGRRLLRPQQAALCTECAEEGWERNIKDICLTINCPVHNRQYLFFCPRCQRRLTWMNQLLPRCICGEILESLPCSWEEAYPEHVLLKIFQEGDQIRFDNLLSILSLLGVQRHKIRFTCDHRLLTVAAALVSDDSNRAAKALSSLINCSDEFEVKLIALKLRSATSPQMLDKLTTQLRTYASTRKTPTQEITVPARFMPALLGISKKQWLMLSTSQAAENISSARHRRSPYTKSEAMQLKRLLKFNADVITVNTISDDVFDEVHCSRTEAIQMLGISGADIDYLSRIGKLGQETRLRTRIFFSRATINQIKSEYIRTQIVSEKLIASMPLLRRAIRVATSKIDFIANRRGNPILIRCSDIPLLEHQLSALPPYEPSLYRADKNFTTTSATEKFISLKEAAAYLRVDVGIARLYRDLGTIACHPEKSYLVSESAVKKFYKLYATPGDLSRQLQIPLNKVAHLLEPLFIRPFSGPSVDGNPNALYMRSKLPVNLKEQLNPTHDNFGAFHQRKELISLNTAAEQLHISKSVFVKIFNLAIRPTRAKCYQFRLEVTAEEIAKTSSFLSSLTKLATFLSERNLSHFSFTRRFIRPNFVRTIKIDDQEYLTQTDTSKLNNLLDNYCNLTDASRLLHATSGTASKLLAKGKITPIFLPGYAYKYPLIKIEEIKQLYHSRCQSLGQQCKL